jgi:MraZ protein
LATTSFTGEYPQRIDGKGRMSIPSDFRRVLEAGDPNWTEGLNPRLQMLYGDHLTDNLEVWTVAAHDAVVTRLKEARPTTADEAKRVRALSYLYITQSCTIEVDKDGRIVMPIRQRQKLGLTDGDVVFAGMGDKFEIWSAGAYEAKVGAAVRDFLGEQPEGFDPVAALWSL